MELHRRDWQRFVFERHDDAAKGSARLGPCLRGRVDASHYPILVLELQQLLLREVDFLRSAFELGTELASVPRHRFDQTQREGQELDGWTLRDYYTSGALADHLIHAALVRIVTLEAFIRLANNGQL